MKSELLTNEWYDAVKRKPWRGRERTLAWNGMYWYDPATRIRQWFNEDGVHPAFFYIFERNFN